MKLTLPTDSKVRKSYPLFSGTFGYFPAALAGVARHSFVNNEKHNPGQDMHWSMDKSKDHAECVQRHLLDTQEMIAALERGVNLAETDGPEQIDVLLSEVNALAWRALALAQVTHMRYGEAPIPSLGYQGDDRPGQITTVRIEPYIDVPAESPRDEVTEPVLSASITEVERLAAAEIQKGYEWNTNLKFTIGCKCTTCVNTALVKKVRDAALQD